MGLILFIFGAIFGSFLNVVALRWDQLNSDKFLSNLTGRSSCPKCGKQLSWFELIPIVSFFVQRRRCLGCKEKISWQYPLIELWTGLVFISIPYIYLPIFCIYIVITIYDFKYKIIPDELVYGSIILSLFIPLFFVEYSFMDWLAGPILFTFFTSIWLLSRGRAMGFGDAKLGLSVGLLLGATQGFTAIVLAFWIGAAVSLIYIFLIKQGFIKSENQITMKSEVPFAPAIIFGAWTSLAFHIDIFNVVLF